MCKFFSYLISVIIFVQERNCGSEFKELPEVPGLDTRIPGPEFSPHLLGSEVLSHLWVFDLPAA